MRLYSLVAAAVLAEASVALGQTAITPASVAARGLPLRADTLDGFAPVNEPRAWFGFYVYQVAKASVNGRSTYLVPTNYTSKEKGTFQSDTLALDAATLAPLWRRFHARSDSADVTFSGTHATGWAEQNGTRVTVDHQLSSASFAAPMLRWISPSLSRGSVVTFTTFTIWTNAEDQARLTVTGEEVLQVGSRRIDAWTLDSPSGSRTWIEKATGRIVQTRVGNGDRATWLVLRSRRAGGCSYERAAAHAAACSLPATSATQWSSSTSRRPFMPRSACGSHWK